MNPLNTTIQIGGHTITTRYAKTVILEGNVGEWQPYTDEILIFPDLPPLYKTLTWWHEVQEAINTIFCDKKMEHTHIENTAQAMLQLAPQLGISLEWD